MTTSSSPDVNSAGPAEAAWLRAIKLDPDRPEPLYQQLYTALRGAILAGEQLGSGARLPASRWLAGRLGVSRNTVVLAYQRLQEDGTVRGMAGGGTVVAAAPTPIPRRPSSTARSAIGLPNSAFPVGVPPLEEFPTALWAGLTNRRLRLSGERVLVGAEQAGHRALREAIAAHLNVIRDTHVRSDRIVVTAGIDATVDVLSRVLARPGGTAWCEEPGYPGIRRVLARNGVCCRPMPVDADGLDVATAIADTPDAALAVLSPAHQVPLGVALSPARRTALLAHADATGMWLVEHENDAAFLRPDAPPPLIAHPAANRVCYLGTFNTSLFPQLHVGYCVLPAELVEPVGAVLCETGADVPGLTQDVLADLLDHHRFARFLQRSRSVCAHRTDVVAAALTRIAGVELEPLGTSPDGGWLTLTLPGPIDESAVVGAAHRVGLHLTPLSDYHADRPTRFGFLLGAAAVRDEAVDPAMRLLAPLLRNARRLG